MIDFKLLDEKNIVRYDESKACMFAYMWSKEDWPCYKNGAKGLHGKGDYGWISVSKAYSLMKLKGYHFYPEGYYKQTYLDAYKLNLEFFNDATDDIRALYLEGKKRGTKWENLESIGNVTDTKVEWVNRERKLANCLLGYISEDEITNEDSTTLDRNDLLKYLSNMREIISMMQ